MAGAGPVISGGKRSMDAEINLVPFIDLLSCCICFLLITAVWVQVAKIDVSPVPNLPGDPMPEQPTTRVELHIGSGGYVLSVNNTPLPLQKAGSDYPVSDLEKNLATVRQQSPDNTAITVRADDSVPYKELISAMDVCLKTGLSDIQVAGS